MIKLRSFSSLHTRFNFLESEFFFLIFERRKKNFNRCIIDTFRIDIPSGCKLARWHFFPRERNFRRRFRAITRDKSLPSLFFDLPPSGNPGNIEGSGNTRGWPPRKHCSLPSFSPELIFEGVKKEKRESKFSIFLSRVGNEIETKRERESVAWHVSIGGKNLVPPRPGNVVTNDSVSRKVEERNPLRGGPRQGATDYRARRDRALLRADLIESTARDRL